MNCIDPFSHKSQKSDLTSPTQKLKRYNVAHIACEAAMWVRPISRLPRGLFRRNALKLNYWIAMSPYVTCTRITFPGDNSRSKPPGLFTRRLGDKSGPDVRLHMSHNGRGSTGLPSVNLTICKMLERPKGGKRIPEALQCKVAAS